MKENIRFVKRTNTKNNFDIIRIEAGTIQGINIPFVLALPQNMQTKSRLAIVFNNENGISLNASAQKIEEDIPKIIEMLKLDIPAVIPILPSEKEFDWTLQNEGVNFQVGESKQFARECFDPRIPRESAFYRLDEQIKKMLQSLVADRYLQSRIQEQRGRNDGLEFYEKLIGCGHSGAGAAMLRFALIHPELFDTLIIGGNGDIIPTPFNENGKKLGYPFGIKDYSELFGRDFPKEEYEKINFQFYIGDREDTKAVYDTIRDENYTPGGTGPLFAPEELATNYKKLYGTSFFERFKNALKQYELAGVNIGLKIYENDCHSMINVQDFHRIVEENNFFDSNCSEQIQTMLETRYKRVLQQKGKDDFDDCR